MTAASAATRTAWLQIHLCVVLWGFTAILGKLIKPSEIQYHHEVYNQSLWNEF